MGLYDRDYYRRTSTGAAGAAGIPGRASPPIGMRGLRALSMNTWLIVLCVLVFVIDGMFPLQAVPVSGIKFYDERYLQIDPGLLVIGQPQPVIRQINGQNVRIAAALVYERNSGTPVGEVDVIGMHPIAKWLHFSTERFISRLEFWRLIGFQFLHGGLAHLVMNMLGLFFIGPLVEQYLGGKRYLAFYLLCGIFGAMMYLLLNLLGYIVKARWGIEGVPGLLFSDPATPLVGASAGIFGVLMAGAYLAPREIVLLFFFIPLQLRTVAYGLVAVALFTIITGGNNAGGEAGHLGGAIAGFYFIRHPHHLHNFFDILGRVDPTSHHYRKGAPRARGTEPRWRSTAADPREVDRILEKINREGLHSLTDQEKRTLAQASER
jgi:membrane associated rhomboid family serine protease